MYLDKVRQLLSQKPEAVLVATLLIVIGGFLLYTTFGPTSPSITTFDQCKQASGSHLLETYPEQCLTAQGKAFVQPLPSGPLATVSGTVTLTPSCPVPTPNPTLSSACQLNPNLLTAYDVVAYRLDHKTVVDQSPLDPQGHYQLKIPAGNYVIDLYPATADTNPVSVSPGQSLQLNLTRQVKVK